MLNKTQTNHVLQVVRKNLTDQINLKPTLLHTVVSSPTDALYVGKTLPGDLTLKNMNEVSNNRFLQLKRDNIFFGGGGGRAQWLSGRVLDSTKGP